MPDDQPDRRPVLAEFIAAAPDLLAGITSGVAQLAGLDPLSSNLAGSAMAIALRIDQTNRAAALGRAGHTAQLTADQLDRDVTDITELVDQTPAHATLTARVLTAAARTPLEQKLPALARVLANGLDGSTAVDEALIHAAALDDLEAPHVTVLATIAFAEPGPDEVGAFATGWADWQLNNALPAFGPVLPVILRTLDRHALIRDITAGTYGGPAPRYVVTDMGTQCLALLDEHT